MNFVGYKKVAAIVVPIYKLIPSEDDIVSLDQCFRILGNYPIVLVRPRGLSLEHYPYTFRYIEDFDPSYFSDIAGYNRLMLSEEFYERFFDYMYILIYQTDAFVFNDHLDSWCRRGYDFIGAPWLYPYVDLIKNTKENIKGWIHRKLNFKERSNIPTENQFRNRVGNGGFSLRKVEIFLEICKQEEKMIQTYLKRTEKEFNEDVFWSIEVNRKRQHLRIPNHKDALSFSVESCPSEALLLLKGNMPFGCHGWDKQKDIWRPIFKKFGYVI